MHIFWDLPGDVLAAPESASGLDRCNTSLSLSLLSYRTLASTMCVCVHACFHIALHVFGVYGTLFRHLEHMLNISLGLLARPLFASVGQASTRSIDSLTWSLFMSLVSVDS